MTNREKWNLYTSHLFSPRAFADFGFLYIIGAALQRRVWMGGENPETGMFPNPYIVFVGPPAVGKGLILDRVKDIMMHHKHEKMERTVSTGKEKIPLFPVGGDTTSFAKLCMDIASNARYYALADRTGSKISYGYTPYCFVLPELSSLFKKENEGAIRLLVSLYDCKDYDNKTKHQGTDYIRKSCVSLLAGTQMTFIKTAYQLGIFDDGFTSRCIFVYEESPFKEGFFLPPETPEQEQARRDILDWILRLSKIYGCVKFKQHKETVDFLETWYKEKHVPKASKSSERMKQYYGRKRAHVMKIAMALHFSESTDFEIELDTFKAAIDLLDKTEIKMEACVNATGKNPLFVAVVAMKKYIKTFAKGVPEPQIRLEFGVDYTPEEINSCLIELATVHGIRREEKPTQFGKCYVYSANAST